MQHQTYRVTAYGTELARGLSFDDARALCRRADELAGKRFPYAIVTEWNANPNSVPVAKPITEWARYTDNVPHPYIDYVRGMVEMYRLNAITSDAPIHELKVSGKSKPLPLPKPVERRSESVPDSFIPNPERYIVVKDGKVLWIGPKSNLKSFVKTHSISGCAVIAENELRALQKAAKVRAK